MSKPGVIKIYNVIGQQVAEYNVDGNGEIKFVSNTSGVFIIKLDNKMLKIIGMK